MEPRVVLLLPLGSQQLEFSTLPGKFVRFDSYWTDFALSRITCKVVKL